MSVSLGILNREQLFVLNTNLTGMQLQQIAFVNLEELTIV